MKVSVFSDGSIEVIETVEQQEPQARPLTGFFAGPGVQLVYAIHDNLDAALNYESRVLSDKIKIAITNEMRVPRRWYFREDIQEWRVDQFSKIRFWPEELGQGWYPYFFSGMTPRQHELFNISGFGWRDSKANAIIMFFARLISIALSYILYRPVKVMDLRPDGVNIYNFIITGGTALLKLKEVVSGGKRWTLFRCQDTNEPPEWDTYESDPTRVFKQGVTGANAAKQSFFGSVNQHQGDLFIPTACPGGIAAILTSEVRDAPSIPESGVLRIKVDGVEMEFVELCFRNSELLAGTTDDTWYYLLEQKTENGNQADYTLHADVFPALPIPFVEWQLM